MEFFETIDRRRSVRSFKEMAVDAATVKRLLDAVLLAPSAGGLQSFRMYLVRDPERRRSLAEASFGQECVAQAPISVVFTADQNRSASKYEERGFELYSVQDATIAAAYIQLTATAAGLASVWVGGFDPLEVSRIVNAGAFEVPVAIIPIGHPAESPERAARRGIGELLKEA